MVKKTYAVVRFDGTTRPGYGWSESEIDTEGDELIGLTFEEAQAELQPVADRYLDQCRRQLTQFDNAVGMAREGHWIEYSVKCCFGIVDSNGWLVDPESGALLMQTSFGSQANNEE